MCVMPCREVVDLFPELALSNTSTDRVSFERLEPLNALTTYLENARVKLDPVSPSTAF